MRGGEVTCCLLLALLLSPALFAQPWPDNGADAAVAFTPGTTEGIGREPQYFPANVLGLPDTTARRDAASVDPAQILSLGLGGEIVLRFDRHLIVDGPGPDFTVFENAFAYSLGTKQRIYAEPGEVSVSRDGVAFFSFPFDSLTLKGCAGVTPTNGDRNPTDPEVSGGDSFDLASLGVDSIRFVRIRDVTSIVKNNHDSPFWDQTLNGFDLDAVVGVNVATPASSGIASLQDPRMTMSIAPNPCQAQSELTLSLSRADHLRVRIIDMLGREVATVADNNLDGGAHRIRLDGRGLGSGRYNVVVTLGSGATTLLPLNVLR